MSEEKLLPACLQSHWQHEGMAAAPRKEDGRSISFLSRLHQIGQYSPPNEARINHSKEPKHRNSRNTAPSCTWLSRLGRQLLVTDSSQNRLKQKCLNFTQAVIYLQQVSGSNGIYEKKML